jgi:hypothetical protein
MPRFDRPYVLTGQIAFVGQSFTQACALIRCDLLRIRECSLIQRDSLAM